METLRSRKSELDVDREATRRAYLETEISWAKYCGCIHCKNFEAARASTYPVEMIDLLNRLGIDRTKELEVLPYRRIDAETYFYAGWFQFVGSMRSGPDY